MGWYELLGDVLEQGWATSGTRAKLGTPMTCLWHARAQVTLENIERERLEMGVTKRNAENEVLRTWNTIPENYVCLKNLATALLTMFSSTYACESLFSIMNFVKSRNRSSMTDETSAACISLNVTKYKSDVKSLS